MANTNQGSIRKAAARHGIEYQEILGKAKYNVLAVIVNGYKFDHLGNADKDTIDVLFDDIACNGVKTAYENHSGMSVARQKVNRACGHTNNERETNYNKQEYTNASFMDNVQFKGVSLTSVLNQYMDREENELNEIDHWTETMRDFHGANYKKVIDDMFKNNEKYIINGYAVTTRVMGNYMNEWARQNGYRELTFKEQVQVVENYKTLIECMG